MANQTTMSSVIKDAFLLWKRGWFKQSMLCFIMLSPNIIIEYMKTTTRSAGTLAFMSLLTFLFAIFILSMLQVAMMHLTIMTAQNQNSSIQESLQIVYSKYTSLIKASFYVSGKVILGCLLIIPGFMWLMKYMFVTIEVLFGSTTKEAMENSERLTDGFKWKMFGIYILGVVIGSIVGAALGVAFNIRSSGGLLFFFILLYFILSFVHAFSIVLWTTLYLHRRQDVLGNSLSTSVSVLMTSLSQTTSKSAQLLFKKYETLHKSMSESNQQQDGLILKK